MAKKNIEQEKKKRGGQPLPPGLETERFWATIDKKVYDRFETTIKGRKRRGQVVESALTIMLDIIEGKRNLPELLNTASPTSGKHP